MYVDSCKLIKSLIGSNDNDVETARERGRERGLEIKMALIVPNYVEIKVQ